MGSLARKMHRNSIKGKSNLQRSIAAPDLSYRQAANKVLDDKVSAVVNEETRKRREAHLKGVKGGNCNREACQKPHAIFFNNGSHAYYCAACTHMLNFDKFNHNDWMSREGHLMVQVDMEAYKDLQALSLTPGGQTRPIERALHMAEHLIGRCEIYR